MKIPKHLGKHGADLYQRIVNEFGIDDSGGLQLLLACCEALDRLRQVQEVIAKDGVTVQDRFGQVRPHPLLTVERDCRTQIISSIKNLNLDLEPLQAIGHPPGVNKPHAYQ